MLIIVCGEDTISSRNHYISLKKDYLAKGFEVKDIKLEEIKEISLWLADSPTLFAQKKVFLTQGLNRHLKKDNKKLIEDLKEIASKKDIDLIDWEEVSQWELKLKKIGQIKEFKPDQTIFKLLDSLYPANRNTFISILNALIPNLDENFVFIMLVRYVRNLILIKEGVKPAGLQAWQVGKMQYQARRWKGENLVNFYEALFKIEIGLKTSSNPFSIKKSLEILACHFL